MYRYSFDFIYGRESDTIDNKLRSYGISTLSFYFISTIFFSSSLDNIAILLSMSYLKIIEACALVPNSVTSSAVVAKVWRDSVAPTEHIGG